MAKEPMYVPEEHLADTVKVIRAGLEAVGSEVDPAAVEGLTIWCGDVQDYLERLSDG